MDAPCLCRRVGGCSFCRTGPSVETAPVTCPACPERFDADGAATEVTCPGCGRRIVFRTCGRCAATSSVLADWRRFRCGCGRSQRVGGRSAAGTSTAAQRIADTSEVLLAVGKLAFALLLAAVMIPVALAVLSSVR